MARVEPEHERLDNRRSQVPICVPRVRPRHVTDDDVGGVTIESPYGSSPIVRARQNARSAIPSAQRRGRSS
jgi:hypothetical protein